MRKPTARGAPLIPGLATALPVITDGGKTYTFTLRKGLVFSNGQPVVASDFTYTVERALKIPWGGSGAFITPNIVGATRLLERQGEHDLRHHDQQRHRADRDPPDGAVRRVRERARVPGARDHPGRDAVQGRADQPAAGRRALRGHEHRPQHVVHVVKNPHWAAMAIPGIPAGHDNVDVKINSNVTRECRRCSTTQPTSSTGPTRSRAACWRRSQSQAKGRYKLVTSRLDVLHLPQRIREAVQQPARPRGGRDRAQPAGDVAAGRRHAHAGVLLPAAGRARPPDRAPARTEPRDRQHRQGEGSS